MLTMSDWSTFDRVIKWFLCCTKLRADAREWIFWWNWRWWNASSCLSHWLNVERWRGLPDTTLGRLASLGRRHWQCCYWTACDYGVQVSELWGYQGAMRNKRMDNQTRDMMWYAKVSEVFDICGRVESKSTGVSFPSLRYIPFKAPTELLLWLLSFYLHFTSFQSPLLLLTDIDSLPCLLCCPSSSSSSCNLFDPVTLVLPSISILSRCLTPMKIRQQLRL